MNKFKEDELESSLIIEKSKGLSTYIKGLDVKNIVWAWIGSFSAILIIASVHEYLHLLSEGTFNLMVASFGASAVLAYGATESPLAQPRNIIGGHMISAIVGVISYKLFSDHIWFASAMAVSLSIVAMLVTKTLHPPGGATALTAVTGGASVHNLGFLFPFFPVGIGASIIVVIAIIINNIPKNRKYPN